MWCSQHCISNYASILCCQIYIRTIYVRSKLNSEQAGELILNLEYLIMMTGKTNFIGNKMEINTVSP